ncbi:MAG TPA: hypothetical protein VFQ25_09065 [Ktedonobacterales bacterium]|nr:hypothetical protein [Ktedonobacterales bacterium]
MFRKTTMRRAVIEGLSIYLAGQLLALISVSFWPASIFPVILVLRMALFILPPVWAAMRVKSTRREKMSRRFWALGPTMAVFATLISALIQLFAGETLVPWGGLVTKPDLARFGMSAAAGGLAPGAFALSVLSGFGVLLVYYTIAVILTRLANGGFLRFTMPAGNGRVTL